MIARTSRSLPPGMPSPPSYQKVNPADQPVLFLTLSSKTMPLSKVDEYAETVLAQRLSMVSGVAGVNVFGAQKFAVRIDVDPTQLAARQIGIDQVASADRRRQRQPPDRHALRPAAQLRRPDQRPVDERRGLPADRRRLPQRQPGPPRAKSPTSTTASRTRATRSWYNGTPAIYLAIERQPGTNTVEVVDAIKALLPQLQAQLPAVARPADPQRPLGLDPRVGRRRQVHAGPDGRSSSSW